jgi:hypothetical protein
MLTCSKCKETKDFTEFKRDKTKKTGYYSSCRDCNKKAWKANYKNIAEKHRAKNKKYAEDNQEKIKAYQAEYYKNNREELHEKTKRWREENRGWANSLRTFSKPRYKKATPVWADRQAINQFYIEAAGLTDLTGIQFHVDHIIPIKGKNVCGLHVETNLQVLVWIDNNRKHNSF